MSNKRRSPELICEEPTDLCETMPARTAENHISDKSLVVHGCDPEVDPPDEIEEGVEDGDGLGSKIIKGALIAGAVFAIAAASGESAQSNRQPIKRKRRRRGRKNHPASTSNEQSSGKPMLPHWLVELDRIRQNTIVNEKALSTRNEYQQPTEGDAIVLLGHLVKRKTAFDAAMLIGSEAMVELALRKPALFKTSRGWFSDVITYEVPVIFEITTPQKLAEAIESELSKMPLWRQHIDVRDIEAMLLQIHEISAKNAAQAEECEAVIARARASVNWSSRRKVKPGFSHYDYVKEGQSHTIAKCQNLINEARVAAEEIGAGRFLKARVFLDHHRGSGYHKSG